jgi:hypothetical protein
VDAQAAGSSAAGGRTEPCPGPASGTARPVARA